MSDTFTGINQIEESGPLVKIDHRNLPDLDLLMLDVYAWQVSEDVFEPFEDRYSYEHDGKTVWGGGDRPTAIAGAWYRDKGAQVGWFRKNPCACGDEHTFDMGDLGFDEDAEFGKPSLSAARGAFMGVYFL